MEAEVMPLPSPEATPPVTKTYFDREVTTGFHANRGTPRREPLSLRRSGRFGPEVLLVKAAQVVQPPEGRRGSDQTGERNGLRQHVESRHYRQGDRHSDRGEPEEQTGSGHEAERVGPRVPEHGHLGQVEGEGDPPSPQGGRLE